MLGARSRTATGVTGIATGDAGRASTVYGRRDKIKKGKVEGAAAHTECRCAMRRARKIITCNPR